MNELEKLALNAAEVERLTAWAQRMNLSMRDLAAAIATLIPSTVNAVRAIEMIQQTPEYQRLVAQMNAESTPAVSARQRSARDVQRKRRPGKYKWGGPEG